MPEVSVVIPCYNHARYLIGAVRSVQAQTYTDWEIIIIDDGSRDGTDRVIDRLTTQSGQGSITAIFKDNGGVAAARNAGIGASSGAYILPLDADDRIAPTMLERSVALLGERYDLAIAYTDGVAFAAGLEPSAIRMPAWDPDRLREENCLASCSLYRRRTWEEVGGYNVQMPSYEDWDFWLGCAERGFNAGHIPATLFGYRIGHTGLHAEGLRRDLELRARIVLNHPRLFSQATLAWAAALVDGDKPTNDRAPEEILARQGAIRALAAARDALVEQASGRRQRVSKRLVAGRRQPAWLRS